MIETINKRAVITNLGILFGRNLKNIQTIEKKTIVFGLGLCNQQMMRECMRHASTNIIYPPFQIISGFGFSR